ncbi:hypothetical protein ACX3O0_09290 [Homoserinimonas sp. A447]
MTPFDESTLPSAAPATVEESTSEGLMLAEYASRMRVKNEIIVGVLTRRDAYNSGDYVGAAADALEHLASEFAGAAERISKEISSIAHLRGSAVHAHDYRSGDAANLRHREAVLDSLVGALRTRRDDDAYLLNLVESARQDAWSDIARAMGDSLDRSTIVVDENYLKERARRMRQVSRDLARLAANSAE